MNLFHNTNLIQAVRDAYNLSIPQAVCVLIAYQHGTVSSLSAQAALNCDASRLSSVSALSYPVRKKVLKEIGKVRVKMPSRPSSVYTLVDPVAVAEVIKQAADRNVELYQTISEYEQTAQEALK